MSFTLGFGFLFATKSKNSKVWIDVRIFKTFQFLSLRLITTFPFDYKIRGWLHVKTPEFIWRRQVWLHEPCDYFKLYHSYHFYSVFLKHYRFMRISVSTPSLPFSRLMTLTMTPFSFHFYQRNQNSLSLKTTISLKWCYLNRWTTKPNPRIISP